MKPSQTIIQNCSSCKLILNNNDDNLIHDDKISKNDRHCEEMIVILVNDCNAGTWLWTWTMIVKLENKESSVQH